MFGKFQICLLIIINILFFNTLYSDNNNNQSLIINGYSISNYNKDILKGLRIKAIGDYYLRQGNLAKALKFYEDALNFLTNEADIYYHLANIYYLEKIYPLAIKYYLLAEKNYLLPENSGKSRKYYYLCQIRKGMCLIILKTYEGNIKEARNIASKLIVDKDELIRDYPDIKEEMELFFTAVYGEVGKSK